MGMLVSGFVGKGLRLLAWILLSSLPLAAGSFNPFEGPKPLIVMLVSDPWIWVVGSDTPKFVLYEDGQVIQLVKESERKATYYWKQMSQQELSQFLGKVKACGPFPKKADRIVLTEATDMPETSLFVDLEGARYVRSVYGLSWGGGGDVPGRNRAVKIPKEVGALASLLTQAKIPGMQIWVPRYVEAMIWPYEYAPEASIYWPKEWPGLSSEKAIKRQSSYSIFLPGAELQRISAFLGNRKEKGAVVIDGRKWAVSVRNVFPCEPVWRSAFNGGE
ncbi:hypothetical protein METESE_24130 [Mesoterricola sediminis]|uniref:Uncharacterized protein n=2 Tax=Mesoterricola sediminis TaxID=2927980 RepID=A0AA48GXI3_9BACT|nr:hypothetical protein METESE_24130 [Mesoterricola sediminis]